MPDQEHKQYIDGKICEIKECPACEGAGYFFCNCEDDCEDETPCALCDTRGYIKK